jgi:plastocyanin
VRKPLLLLLVVIAAVCAGPAAAGTTKTTSLKDDFFVKGKLTVTKGTTVVWKWHTDDEHTVTEVHGRWGSTNPKTKGTVKHKFTKRGKFTVYCVVHPTIMRQKIVVK